MLLMIYKYILMIISSTRGWVLINAVADASDPSTGSAGLGYNNAYGTFSVAKTVDLDTLDIFDAGHYVGGNAVVSGNLGVGVVGAASAPLHVYTTGVGDTLRLETNDDGASTAPDLSF